MKKNKIVGFRVLSAVLILSSLLLTSCGSSYPADNEAPKAGQVKGVSRQPYGVYLSCEYEELPANLSCDEVVIDAQYFTAQEIASLKKKNGKVYSYLNVGSLEDFREYFKKFDRLILGAYENWEGEYWVDVSDSKWQDFLVDEIASDMLKKGVDGFFIDNCDVYYVNHEKKIFDGLTAILKRLKKTGARVIINGGDTYVSEYLEEYGNLKDVLDGVNQESVYTRINWDKGTFSESDPDDREYFLEYLANVKKAGKDVYVLEYTKDKNLANKATKACKKLGYTIYVSDSLELN